MIEIKELTVKFQNNGSEVLVLDKINLEIEDGEIYTIIGPSGCGKSTLLNVLAGVQKKYEGKVSIQGSTINPKIHNIGMVFQNYGLLPWKTVYENSTLGLKIKGDKSYKKNQYANYILEELGLSDLVKRYPRALSGGQAQRVAIARAFINKPELLLMDEPFSALDAITREEMQELFLKIWKEHRVTTIFITHSVDEALYLGKRIIVLSNSPGRIYRIIENDVFGVNNLRVSDEYFQKTIELRKIIEMGWSK